MEKVLFVTSEAHPLIKTGGLGDVSGSLPGALARLQRDLRIVLPNYRGVAQRCDGLSTVAELDLPGGSANILAGRFPGTGIPLYLIDSPAHFDRDGGPYAATADAEGGIEAGKDWPDNADRFGLFCRAVVELAMNRCALGWAPDVVHCNDWQSGLVPALLSTEHGRPATVFTIHNLAYQGLFPSAAFSRLRLPPGLWHPSSVEFHGQVSFMKGGLAHADMLSTVSPTYAREIRGHEFGYGLEGLLEGRSDRLMGILNGVDYDEWDPRHDRFIEAPYSSTDLRGKAVDKAALEQEFGLEPAPDIPLIGMVGRMVEQKGIDLILAALPRLLKGPARLVVLGSGDIGLELAWRAAAKAHPKRIAVRIGYDEGLAHRVEAGADLFLMPSRYEPCGLNQIYSLRYGTVPVVRRTGGLADTVTDATSANLTAGRATGVVFDAPSSAALADAVDRALALYAQPKHWRRIMVTGMNRDFGWAASAWQYALLYRRARDLLQ